MKILLKCFIIMSSALLLTSLAMAQQATPESLPSMQMQSPAATVPSSPAAEQSAQPMQKMDKMADSVTKMSEMCQMMMQKEMASAHCKMAAGITVGILLFLALVLFVILE